MEKRACILMGSPRKNGNTMHLLTPFMDELPLTRIAARAAKKEGVSALMPLLPFLNDERLGDFLGEWLGRKGK